MKQYQLVDALAWEKSVCSVLFESADASIALAQQNVLSAALNQPLGVVDTWSDHIHFPPNAKPLFKTEQEIPNWLRKHEAKRRQQPAI